MRMRSHTTWAYTITLLCVLAPALPSASRSAKRQRRRGRRRAAHGAAASSDKPAQSGGKTEGPPRRRPRHRSRRRPDFIDGHGQGSRLRDSRFVALDGVRRRRRLGAGRRSGSKSTSGFGCGDTARRAIGTGRAAAGRQAASQRRRRAASSTTRPCSRPVSRPRAGARSHRVPTTPRARRPRTRRARQLSVVAGGRSPRRVSRRRFPRRCRSGRSDARADTCADADPSLTRDAVPLRSRSSPGGRRRW